MRQIVRALRDGKLDLLDVPERLPSPKHVLIRTQRSLISAGTERSVARTASASLVGKARQQPDRVRQVIEKAAADGVGAAKIAVQSKLDSSVALGYASCGVVVAAGEGVTKVSVGDLVASNGPHGELVEVSQNLIVPVPDGVQPDQAAFATVGAIGLQGIRLADPTLGETVVVIGLGLVGLLTTQLLRASGCRVIGIDPIEARRKLAESFGVIAIPSGSAVVDRVRDITRSNGADAVLITASTTSNEPIHQAAQMCRKRGRIVLTGVVGMTLQRADFYEKELSFQVSCSYGPGRYDPGYEDEGQDYPIAYVRWTEARNMEAVLDAIGTGKIDVDRLITHRFRFEDAEMAYAALTEGSAIAIILEYPEMPVGELTRQLQPTVKMPRQAAPIRTGAVRVGVLGAGAFAGGVLLPALVEAGADVRVVASAGGTSASFLAKRFGVAAATTDVTAILSDPQIDAVVIATRHNSHAALTVAALNAGKHVYVEKPLAIDVEQLSAVGKVAGGPILHVGFNRRFSPTTEAMMRDLADLGDQRFITITVNAGAIPADHWTQNRAIGGGRIIGEGCHFIDLARCLAQSPIASTSVQYLDNSTRDSAAISLTFESGSLASINYVCVGSRRFPKERVSVFAAGSVLVNENFRSYRTYPGRVRDRLGSLRPRPQDKGHSGSVRQFLAAVQSGGPPPIPLDETLEVSFATLVAGGDSRARATLTKPVA